MTNTDPRSNRWFQATARYLIETGGTESGLAELHTGLPTQDPAANSIRIALGVLAAAGVVDLDWAWAMVWEVLLDFADWDAPRV